MNMYEKVNPSHPDKIADRIAGAVVDLAYKKNKSPKVACEVLIGHGTATIITETSEHFKDDEIIDIVERIAGKQEQYIIRTIPQDTHLAENQIDGVRCGDNGIFKGVPTTPEQSVLAEKARAIYATIPHDGKYIIADGRFYVCQSNTDDNTEGVIRTCLHPEKMNPLGRWTGGTNVDAGATNRKLGSDMGDAVTGGGLHGKDLSKADVSVNVYLWAQAQKTEKKYKAYCTIGSDEVIIYEDGKLLPYAVKYADIVNEAREIIDTFGGFERLAEWGLI